MGDRWVNAVIELRVPMDISPGAPLAEKGRAAEVVWDKYFSEIDCPDMVGLIRVETAEADC